MNNKTSANLTRHYDEKYSNQSGPPQEVKLRRYPRERFEAAVKWAERGEKMLDIGAGHGNVIQALRSLYKECVGTEISTPRVTLLKQNFADDPNVQILKHNIETEKLPFSDEYFDTVFLIDVIEHLVDPISALMEIQRVVKKGGKLFVATPNIAKWTRRIKLVFGYFPSTASRDEGFVRGDGQPTDLYDEGHLHYFTYRSLSHLLTERVGFSKTIRHGHGRHGPLCAIWPTLMSDISLSAIK